MTVKQGVLRRRSGIMQGEKGREENPQAISKEWLR